MITGSSARIAWFDTLGASTERDRPAPDVVVPAPADVRAERGRDQVTVSWSPVDGAVGYLVHRGPRDGELVPIDHKGGDVLAVPHSPYVDTTPGSDGDNVYAVASLSSIDAPVGPLSAPVTPVPIDRESEGEVRIAVDAARSTGRVPRPWRPIIGSEHLAMLLRGEGPGGLNVGEDLALAFRIVREELGVEASGRTPSCTTFSACTARTRTAARTTTSTRSTSSSIGSWRRACGRSWNCRSCRRPSLRTPIRGSSTTSG